MFSNVRTAADGSTERIPEFRVDHACERVMLLRRLVDGNVPVTLHMPDGGNLATRLWTVDAAQQRLNFWADESHPLVQRLVDADEAVAVAYLDAIKLQFDVHGLVIVRGVRASVLQADLPAEVWRFQRRRAYRVCPDDRQSPKVYFRHPAIPEMALALRVIDISIGGCALLLPPDVPPVEPGIRIGDVNVELDAETRFAVMLTVHHVTTILPADHGTRLGCEWGPLASGAERALQRWIDQSQKRRRLLAGG